MPVFSYRRCFRSLSVARPAGEGSSGMPPPSRTGISDPAMYPSRLIAPPNQTSRIIGYRSVSFWTLMLLTSPTSRLFSLRQSIELTVPNSFGSFPALPNLPTMVPSSFIL
jgi:hypothetical protein